MKDIILLNKEGKLYLCDNKKNETLIRKGHDGDMFNITIIDRIGLTYQVDIKLNNRCKKDWIGNDGIFLVSSGEKLVIRLYQKAFGIWRELMDHQFLYQNRKIKLLPKDVKNLKVKFCCIRTDGIFDTETKMIHNATWVLKKELENDYYEFLSLDFDNLLNLDFDQYQGHYVHGTVTEIKNAFRHELKAYVHKIKRNTKVRDANSFEAEILGLLDVKDINLNNMLNDIVSITKRYVKNLDEKYLRKKLKTPKDRILKKFLGVEILEGGNCDSVKHQAL